MDNRARISKCRQLIHLVKNRPIIYNFYLKEHNNREATEEAWQDISNQLSISAVDCKTKWMSLRNCYGRSLREERSNQGNRRRTWYLADEMAFLREFMNRKNYFESRFKSAEWVSCNNEQHDDHSLEASEFEMNKPVDENEDAYSQESSPENESNQFMETGNNSPAGSSRSNQNSNAIHNSGADSMFFGSLMEDFKKISRRRQRTFKEAMLSTMNKLLNEEEAQLESQFLGQNQIRIAQVKTMSSGLPSGQSVKREVYNSSIDENSL